MAWCELDSNSWSLLQRQRELAGVSRKELGGAIGVYDRIIQQWEQKIDNVMPRFSQFEKYLNHLTIKSEALDYRLYLPKRLFKK